MTELAHSVHPDQIRNITILAVPSKPTLKTDKYGGFHERNAGQYFFNCLMYTMYCRKKCTAKDYTASDNSAMTTLKTIGQTRKPF